MCDQKNCLTVAAALALILCTTAFAVAGGGPSEDNCKDMGYINCECFICDTKEYKGTVSVLAEYDPLYGDCMKRSDKAHDLCIQAYNLEQSKAAVRWSY